jgi:hypothetical protein
LQYPSVEQHRIYATRNGDKPKMWALRAGNPGGVIVILQPNHRSFPAWPPAAGGPAEAAFPVKPQLTDQPVMRAREWILSQRLRVKFTSSTTCGRFPVSAQFLIRTWPPTRGQDRPAESAAPEVSAFRTTACDRPANAA